MIAPSPAWRAPRRPPLDKRTTAAEISAELRDGMTLGIGGWGSRRKPMALVREILRSPVRDLTVVSYGGPDVGLLCAAGKVRKVIYGFVSLDSIPLEPQFRKARQSGSIEAVELDEGMLQWGLYAAALRLPFLPTRAGLGLAIVHMNRADARGNAQFLGPDFFFDDLFLGAAKRRFVSCEKLVPTEELTREGSFLTLRIHRGMVDGVVETPRGAHFTECPPDYGRDEAFQSEYAKAARDPEAWKSFEQRYLALDSEDEYQRAVAAGAGGEAR
jgi:glutaconate CoA-transferase subunit A